MACHHLVRIGSICGVESSCRFGRFCELPRSTLGNLDPGLALAELFLRRDISTDVGVMKMIKIRRIETWYETGLRKSH